MPKNPLIGDDVVLYNNTGSDVAAGVLVCTNGWDLTNNAHKFVLAQADDAATLAEFVTAQAIPDGHKGFASREFVILNQNTSTASAIEDSLYLSATTPGAWTVTAPRGTNFVQRVGSVALFHAVTGAVHFDLPNSQAATIPTHHHTDGSQGGQILSDDYVKATIAVADATGGGTTAALTVDLTQADGSSSVGSARQVMIVGQATAYVPGAALNGNVTFGTATVGSIIASGSGWCLALTSAGGAFACTATNATDEAILFSVSTPPRGVSDLTQACLVIGSNSDTATWSA